MSDLTGDVRQRLAHVRERIAGACGRAGRDPAEVTLVAASKAQPPDKILAAYEAGVTAIGENRVQEAKAKAARLPPGIEWHMLGPLQSNKARAAVELFSAIHSIDRLKIAHHLDREAERQDRSLEGFLEVNLGGEASKHGFSPEGLPAAAEELVGLRRLRLVGLMAVPPLEDDPRRWFRRLRALRDELGALAGWESFPGCLSMGMSADFEAAVEEGATHVRLGTVLFGPRPGEG